MRRALDVAALGAVLALAFVLRAGGLALLHDRGDQLIWAGLARNVAARGLAGYTVRGIDSAWQVVPGSSEVALVRAELAPPGSGSLVRGLVASGEAYWDAPLANQPPGFTALLVLSHALLGREGDGFPLLGRAPGFVGSERELALRIAARPPAGVVRAQLWASVLPIVSDLVTVGLLWLAGVRLLRSRRAALVIALAFATDPLALYASHRILSNATLAAATLGAILVHGRATSRTGFALAGALAGLAITVKVSAIFLVPAGVLALGRRWRESSVFAASAALIGAPWSFLQWRLLGNPLGMAWERAHGWPQGSAWGLHVTSRGLLYYPGVLASSPLVLAGLGLALFLIVRRRLLFPALFSVLVLLAALVHSGGKEARHLLLVYPCGLLVLGTAVEPARRWLRGVLGRPGEALLALLLGVVFFQQARTGLAWAMDTGGSPP